MLRRTFLAAASTAPALAAPRLSKPLGLSLYTVRAPLASRPAETYRDIAAIGISELEVRPDNLRNHAPMIRDAGLKPVHMFIDSAIVTGAWDEWRTFTLAYTARLKQPPPPETPRASLQEMLDLANLHNVHRIGVSFILPDERKVAVHRLNAAVSQCADAGIELYYHNHAFEFQGAPGKRYIDTLLARLDPRVRLELDVFWASVGGDDPADLIRRANGRVASLHLKDAAADAPRNVSEFSMPPAAFKEVGAGVIDWSAVLKAAAKAKVDHYMIEQDHCPGNPLDSIRRGVDYLRGRG